MSQRLRSVAHHYYSVSPSLHQPAVEGLAAAGCLRFSSGTRRQLELAGVPGLPVQVWTVSRCHLPYMQSQAIQPPRIALQPAHGSATRILSPRCILKPLKCLAQSSASHLTRFNLKDALAQ
jgi:hypothetical protein